MLEGRGWGVAPRAETTATGTVGPPPVAPKAPPPGRHAPLGTVHLGRYGDFSLLRFRVATFWPPQAGHCPPRLPFSRGLV